MSAARPYCDDCKRTFVDQNALWQHRKFHHRMGKADNPNPRPRDDEDTIPWAVEREIGVGPGVVR